MESALRLASRTGMCAYDAYFLDCALRRAAPLLTLDHALCVAAEKVGLHVLEI